MELVEVLREIGIAGARYVEEHGDLQFLGMRRFNDPKAVVLNALVSYQLSGTGEQYWTEFFSWFASHPFFSLQAFLHFLENSRYNRRLLRAKAERAKKAWEFLSSTDIESYYPDYISFWQDLSGALSSPPRRKTVVLAVKMYGYAMRIRTGKFHPYPFEVPIPLDSRIQRITRAFSQEDPLDFWFHISRESNVPPLHIDSVLWNPLGSDTGKKALLDLGAPGYRLWKFLEPFARHRNKNRR